MYKIFGIRSCDTIKKTLKYFKDKDLPFSFHDYRIEGIEKEVIEEWVKQVGLDTIFNKKSTTWRELDEAFQKTINTEKKAIKLMADRTTLIKRPVITKRGKVVAIGFSEEDFKEKFRT